jgi:opacity protein-like surface antigen
LTVPYTPVVEAAAVAGGWYLRGDIGIGIERGRFRENEFDAPPPGYKGRWVRQTIDDTTSFGVGVGYQFNEWFRGDITAEYRTATAFRLLGRQSGQFNGVNGTAYAHITGSVSSTVVLANAYADLGNYHGITPYVGAGLGVAYNRITGAGQSNTIPSPIGPVPVIAKYQDGGKLSLAWALHAGASYDVNERLKLDIGYRYLDLGTASTGFLYGLDNNGGTTKYPDKLSMPSFASHDFRIGARWMFDAPTAYRAPVAVKY